MHGSRELALQHVAEEQRALIAGNVLEALKLTQQERQHATSSGLLVKSNDLHKVVADAAVEGLHLKSASAQRAIEAAHLKSFRDSLEDDTVAGLCVMLASALWYSWSNGFLNIHLGRCRSSRGWASNAHASPMLKLVLGLGVTCGLIGRWAISCTGGAAWAWVALWESWQGDLMEVADWILLMVSFGGSI
ncbi:hypothetical protein WJX73_003650 [Symbiochloris irregularis]|uniref:Uncharacterized protein n=1 Tax=Symbiochloris irregularis TaxID=706552 RepID=A0AAW1NMQ0_9CHLO